MRLRFKSGSDPNTKTSTRPASVFFSKYALLAGLALILLAAWAQQSAVVILLGLGLAAAALSRLWSRLSLKGVSCARRLSETRLFPGESLELKIRLVNRKILPLPWVQVTDEVPAGSTPEAAISEEIRPGFAQVTKSTTLWWYAAAAWQYRLTCPRRGYYALGPLTITSGDIFGFYPRRLSLKGSDYILVYPRLFPLDQNTVQSLYPLGEVKINQPIFEDPCRIAGIRDYVPGDSLKRVHWKASLRQGALQVKVLEPSTTLRATIFLAIDSYQHEAGWRLEEMETGISLAASLAADWLEKRNQVGLYCNTRLADTGQPARLAAGAGSDHRMLLLEALAKTVNASACPFLDFFQAERNSLSQGTSLVFIFSRLPDNIQPLFLDLRERGYRISVFLTGEDEPPSPVAGVRFFQTGRMEAGTTLTVEALG